MQSVKKTMWIGVVLLVLGMISTAIWPGDAEAGEKAFIVFGTLPTSHLVLMCGGLVGLALAGRPGQKRFVRIANSSENL